MKTAVVILNWNTRDYLQRFLPTLIESCQGMDAEVIVADSASTDGSMELMRTDFPQVRRIELDSNYGFTGGYNRALKGLDATYYVLINSDIEVSQGWLQPLVEWMDSHPECGACGPKLLSYYERDNFEYAGAAGGCIDSLGYTFCRGRVMSRVEQDHGQYDSPARVFWATGACLMVRKTLWEDLGGLDDRFFAHMEEIDLCWRLHLSGYSVCVVPQSVVYHLGGGTLPSTSPWKLELNFRNNLLMLYNNLEPTYEAEGRRLPGLRAGAVITLRYLLDLCSALVYLLDFRHHDYARAVFRGHRGFWKLKGERGRSATPKGSFEESFAGIYRGSIIFAAVLHRSRVFDKVNKRLTV